MVFAWTLIFVGIISGLCLFFWDYFHLPAGVQIWLTRDDKLVMFDHYLLRNNFFFHRVVDSLFLNTNLKKIASQINFSKYHHS